MPQFTFEIYADTIDGKILRCPQPVIMKCESAKPLGQDIVKQFNGNECIVAKKCF